MNRGWQRQNRPDRAYHFFAPVRGCAARISRERSVPHRIPPDSFGLERRRQDEGYSIQLGELERPGGLISWSRSARCFPAVFLLPITRDTGCSRDPGLERDDYRGFFPGIRQHGPGARFRTERSSARSWY